MSFTPILAGALPATLGDQLQGAAVWRRNDDAAAATDLQLSAFVHRSGF